VCCRGAGGGGLQPSEQAILADTCYTGPTRNGVRSVWHGGSWPRRHWDNFGRLDYGQFYLALVFFINVPVGIISLLLTSRLDFRSALPEKTEACRRRKSHYLGSDYRAGARDIAIVLDKGQRADWFETPYIRVFTFIFVTALILAIIWELRVKDPVVDLRLFKDRTFMTGNIMLFVLGFVFVLQHGTPPAVRPGTHGLTTAQTSRDDDFHRGASPSCC